MSNKDRFSFYFAADLISQFGSGMSFIGLNWYILNSTGSNTLVGDLFSLNMIAAFAVFPLSGYLADFFNRKKVMQAMNGIRGVSLAALAILFFTGRFHIVWLFALKIINGAAGNIFFSSSRALAQELLERDKMMKGNSLIEFSMQVGNFASAALAGLLYKYGNIGIILLIDAATYLASNICLGFISYKKLEQSGGERFFRKFSDGIAYLKANSLIFGLGLAMLIPQVVTACSNIVFPDYILNHLKADSVVYGMTDMSYAVGAAGAGFLTVYVARRLSTLRAVFLFHSLTICALFFLTANHLVAGVFAASVIWGYSNSSIRILINTRIMEMVPETFMGRTTAVWRALSMIMMFSSSFLLGRLLDQIPASLGFTPFIPLMFSGLILCTWFLIKLNKRERRLS